MKNLGELQSNVKKISAIAMLFIILLLFRSETAYALGIIPAQQKTMLFEPNSVIEQNIIIINNEKKQLVLEVAASGELAQFIELSQQTILMNDNEHEKTIAYSVRLPDSFQEPGIHVGHINIIEAQSGDFQSSGIASAIGLSSTIQVMVPYDGLYLVPSLEVVASGQQAAFYFLLENRGTEPIVDGMLATTITAEDGSIVEQFPTKTFSLGASQRKEIIQTWENISALGTYNSLSIIGYGSQKAGVSKGFVIGDFFLEPTGIGGTVDSDGKAKIAVQVRNKNYRTIEQAYATLSLKKVDGLESIEASSSAYDLEGSASYQMDIFADISAVPKGLYEGILTLHYANAKNQYPVLILYAEKLLHAEIVGVSKPIEAHVEQPRQFGSRKITIIALLVGLLLSLVVAMYNKHQRRKKNSKAIKQRKTHTVHFKKN